MAGSWASGQLDYAGDVTSDEAFRRLSDDPAAVLVDVRTRAEWTFVGLPDLTGLGRTPILIEWQRYPEMSIDEDFVDRLERELALAGAGRDSTILFLCRSGGRSAAAARALAARGYEACLNISDGFEGPADALGHRGTVAGWKARGLPWRQG